MVVVVVGRVEALLRHSHGLHTADSDTLLRGIGEPRSPGVGVSHWADILAAVHIPMCHKHMTRKIGVAHGWAVGQNNRSEQGAGEP